ncbi:peptide-methionine (S)-S-oxide reductase [Agromyces humi]
MRREHAEQHLTAVTTIEPTGPFWEAEPEHQDYLERMPWGYTCHARRRLARAPQLATCEAPRRQAFWLDAHS